MLSENQNRPGTIEDRLFETSLRFISGEMDAEEQALFERRVIDEPEVAILLSEILELEDAVATIHPSAVDVAQPTNLAPRPKPPQRTRQSAVPLIVAIASCALVVISFLPRATLQSPTVAVTDVSTQQPAEFVDQWLEAIAISEPGVVESDDERIELALLDQDDAFESDAIETVPNWMFAAFEQDNSAGGTVE